MTTARPVVKPAWQRALITMSAAVTVAVVIAAVYWMRALFIPIAMAVYFTYVLAPLVVFAQRRGLGRVPAVLLAVGVAVLLFLGTSYLVVRQVSDLSDTLTGNKDKIVSKLSAARRSVVGDGESGWAKMVAEFENTLAPPPEPNTPKEVVVRSDPPWVSRLNAVAGPVSEAFAQAAFAFVLVVFMLLSKEDLQDRLLRLFGETGVTTATRATSEVGRRLSRFLLTQLVLNISFGLLVAAVLFLMGVGYAPLWGFVVFLMRYVPYIGTWIGVIFPTLFSLAVSDGWAQPITVLVLVLGMELVCNNVVEPKVYGASLGVSEVALLVSAALWAFLWGPIGLILSGPITTCLLALGKYLPPFRVLYVLLGTDPPLTAPLALFQRLMARNQDEAVRVVTEAIPADAPERVFDDAVVPALSMVVQAKRDGEFEGDDERQVLGIADEVIDELAQEVRSRGATPTARAGEQLRLLACPAADDAERLAVEAFAAVLPGQRWEVKVTSADTLASELLHTASEFDPAVVVVSSLPPHGLAHVRYLCKRLRTRLPNAYILVGRWGATAAEDEAVTLSAAGASAVTNTLLDARARLSGYRPVLADRGSESVVPGAAASGAAAFGTAPA